MDKKVALTKLIENSFLIGNKVKLLLLEKVEYMTDSEVDKLGKLMVLEREIILADEAGFLEKVNFMVKSAIKKTK